MSKLKKLGSRLLPSKEEWTNHTLKDKLGVIVSYLVIVTALIGGLKAILPSPLPLNYIDANKPYLEANLVIYKVDSTGIHYNYTVRNNGSLPAKNLIFSQRNEGLIMGEFEGNQRDLAPDGEMLVKNAMMFSISSIQLKDLNKFVLIASYDADFGGTTKSYNSTFTFSIPYNEIGIGKFKYNDVRRAGGKFGQANFGKFLNNEWPKIRKKRDVKPEEIVESYTYISLIKLKDTALNRVKFIFDLGEEQNKNRLSLYVNENNDLIFRAIDKKTNKDSITIKYNPKIFERSWIFNCQYGLGKDFTILRLYLNNSLVGERRITRRLQIDHLDLLSNDMLLGSDLSRKNGGFFDLVFLDKANTLIELDRINEIVQSYKGRSFGTFYEFKGGVGLKSDRITVNHSSHIFAPNLNDAPEEAERFNGYSLLINMKLLRGNGRKDKYIIDGGQISKNRVSVLLDNYNNLLFQVIDQESNSWITSVNYNKDLFEKYHVFHFEIGISDDYSFMRIILDGKTKSKNAYECKIPFNNVANLQKDMVLGADINRKNNSTFYVSRMAQYSSTLTQKSVNDIYKYLTREEISKWMFFDGTSSMATDKIGNGNSNLESGDFEAPAVHLEK